MSADPPEARPLGGDAAPAGAPLPAAGAPLPAVTDPLGGQAFVVGGASRGIGLAVATELLGRGAEVLLLARQEDRLREACGQLGPGAHPLAADLADPGAVEVVAAAVRSLFAAGLSGMLVNAGGPPRGSVLGLDDATWAQCYELLLGGPIRLVRRLAPSLLDGAGIVFVASSSVREPVPGLDASNVLRPAVAALARSLARELAPRVRVNVLAPGRFDTDRAREGDERAAAAAGISVAEQRERSAARIPMGRYGEPAELAQAASFLLSPAASYITAATLHVDGGLVSSAP